ncbi:hypothetical protein V5799_031717 [Amblyomma americanum]|uniref:Lipase domain-containing protein n=1 Tax=Amblyomma americanum TaxID=6943 RepID=A0AAQ4DT78_AMBAM
MWALPQASVKDWAGQRLHPFCWCSSWYVPGGQAKHVPSPPLEPAILSQTLNMNLQTRIFSVPCVCFVYVFLMNAPCFHTERADHIEPETRVEGAGSLAEWDADNYLCEDWGEELVNDTLLAIELTKTLRALPTEIIDVLYRGMFEGIGDRVNSTESLRRNKRGLDPAGPLFVNTDVSLSRKDAVFVDIIHTHSGRLEDYKLGIAQSIGHVDFYPNGGSSQVGCEALWKIGCSHKRAQYYFIESLTNEKCHFISYNCEGGWADYDNCKKQQNVSYIGEMGFYSINRTGRGDQYLRTNKEPPYCTLEKKCHIPDEDWEELADQFLAKMPNEFTFPRGSGDSPKNNEILAGITVGDMTLTGLDRLERYGTVRVYCKNGKPFVSVSMVARAPLKMSAPWKYCGGKSGLVGTQANHVKVCINFEVDEVDGKATLRPVRVSPKWIESLDVKLDGAGDVVKTVSSIVGKMMPAFVKDFWIENLPWRMNKVLEQIPK